VTVVWDLEAIAKAMLTIGTPILTVAGLGSRNRRIRHDIKENLALVEEVEKHPALREASLSSAWLQGRVALDIARLTRQDFGPRKKAIPWSSVALAFILGGILSAWTYFIVRDGLVWYAVFPACGALLFAVSIVGMTTDRGLAPETANLPPGAVRAPTATAQEQVATSVALMAHRDDPADRLRLAAQSELVFTFVKLLQLGAYEAAIELADENWVRCRVYAWLWNNQPVFGEDVGELTRLADALMEERDTNEHWNDFVGTESRQFMAEWGDINFDEYGIAGNRRRVAPNLDAVIITLVGSDGGYFVMSATAIPNAMTFLLVGTGTTWKVANHAGIAPPLAEWPPVWWITDDPVMHALPEHD
jgi:hypothetical protein